MAASNTDLLRKGARKWVGQIGSGGVADDSVTTIPLSSATGLPTDTAIDVVIGRVDSAGTLTASLEETVTGVVSGTNLVNCVRGEEGTAQSHLAGAVVEVLLTNNMWGDVLDAFLAEHNQDGTHADVDLANSIDFTTEHNADGTHFAIQPAFMVYRNGNQALESETFTKVEFNVEEKDVGNAFDAVTNHRFTVPAGKAGWYIFSGCVRGNSPGDTKIWLTTLYKNGTLYKRLNGIEVASALNEVHLGFSANIYLAAADYIEVFAYHSAGVSKDITGGASTSWFSGAYLGS